MTFFSEVITGDLILIRTNIPTPPACPVLANSVPKADTFLVRFILWLVAWLRPIVHTLNCIGHHWPPPIWTRNKAKLTILTFLAGVLVSVILENLAAGYIDKAIGA